MERAQLGGLPSAPTLEQAKDPESQEPGIVPTFAFTEPYRWHKDTSDHEKRDPEGNNTDIWDGCDHG
ncbi:hypothetical protein [Streptomyces sp. NPDC058255]|uniref:hypothetical protein n=1 Tax=Streptomyces sp. NPDC058255 TaxID=3346407 RepID=UPI0036EC406F